MTQCRRHSRPPPTRLPGFIPTDSFVAERLLDAEEVDLLKTIARADHQMQKEAASRGDGEGGAIRLVVENEVHDDIYGAIVRSRRIVETMESLLDGEVYHYHHKMILKEPYVGGAWAWHQDYGYWYHNGCLAPLLASCMIALDRATRQNGCLQVVRGSHLLGGWTTAKSATRPASPTRNVCRRCSSGSSWCTANWNRARRFSSTATCCTARTRTKAPTRAGPSSPATTPAATTRTMDSRHPRYTPLEKWDDAASTKSAAGSGRNCSDTERQFDARTGSD